MNFTKGLKTTACSLALMAFCAGAAGAQEAAKPETPKAPEKAPIEISGVLFMDYSYLLSSKDSVTKAEENKQDSFNLTRAYLTASKKIDDVWSAKLTLDACGNNSAKDNDAFLKNAYVQYGKKLDVVDLKVQAGLTGTPIIGLLDGFTGSRWIYQNYLDKSSDISGKSFDVSSADTGLKPDMKIMKMVTLTGMYSNGDGYKVKTQDNAPVTKAYYGVLNINPAAALNVFGFYHWHDTAGDASKNFISYYGGGVAWSDKMIKVGASYTILDGKAADIKQEATTLEAWANVNLNDFIGAPVLLIGRYAMSEYKDKQSTEKKNEGSAIWGGIGYQMNSNVQMAAMYKLNTLEKKTGSTSTSDLEESSMYVKSEIKF
jgi:hypothetical protein